MRSGCLERTNSKNDTTLESPTILSNGTLKCPYCEKTSTSENAMFQHIRTHAQEKPFICSFDDKCDKKFSSSYGLKYHLETKHKKPNQLIRFACDIEGCQQLFADPITLERHIITNHEDS